VACRTHDYVRSAYTILIGKLEGKRLLGRHRHRWENNVGMRVRETCRTLSGFVWLWIGTTGGLF